MGVRNRMGTLNRRWLFGVLVMKGVCCVLWWEVSFAPRACLKIRVLTRQTCESFSGLKDDAVIP